MIASFVALWLAMSTFGQTIAAQDAGKLASLLKRAEADEIGRASCRERV